MFKLILIWLFAITSNASRGNSCHNRDKPPHLLTQDTGIIKSSFRDNLVDRTTYVQNSDCTWLIRPSSFNGAVGNITFEILMFEVASSDSVNLIDDQGSWVNSLTGTINSTVKITIYNVANATVYFLAQGSWQLDGFYIIYSVNQASTEDISHCPYNCTVSNMTTGTCVNNSYCKCIDGVNGLACTNDDGLRLRSFYQSCNGDYWSFNASTWLNFSYVDSTYTYCDNNYVYCDSATNRISGLYVVYQNVTCPFGIPYLPIYSTWVYLAYNSLGMLTATMFRGLTQLSQLYLCFCDLTGLLPESLGDASRLSYLELSYNNLTGTIPLSFQKMGALSYLSLDYNNLFGLIPDTWQYLPDNTLNLAQNQFWCSQTIYSSISSFDCVNLTVSSIDPDNNNNVLTVYGSNFPVQKMLSDPLLCLFGNTTAAMSSTATVLDDQTLQCQLPDLLPSYYQVNLQHKDKVVGYSESSDSVLQVYQICYPGTYSPDGLNCAPCPSGAQCLGGQNKPIAAPGYIRDPTNSTVYYPCIQASSCLGGSNLNYSIDTICATGYHGFRCTECDTGYSSMGDGICLPCSSTDRINFVILSVAVLFILASITLSMAKNHFAFAGISILILFCQVTGVLFHYDFGWSGYLQGYLSMFSYTVLNIHYLRLSCAYNTDYFTEFNLIIAIVPMEFLLQLIIMGIRGFVNKVKRGNYNWEHYKTEMISAMLAFLSLVHLPISDSAFSVLHCIDVPERSYISSDPDIKCYDSVYNSNIYKVYLTICLYSFGIPLLYLLIVILNYKRLYEPHVYHRYADVYKPFLPSKSFWEALTMIFHIMLTLFPVFLKEKYSLLAFMLAAIFFFYTMLLQWLRPYRYFASNVMASIAVGSLMVIVVCGMIYQTATLSQNLLDDIGLAVIWAHGFITFSIICFSFFEYQYAKRIEWERKGKLTRILASSWIYKKIFGPAVSLEELIKIHPHLKMGQDHEEKRMSIKRSQVEPSKSVHLNKHE